MAPEQTTTSEMGTLMTDTKAALRKAKDDVRVAQIRYRGVKLNQVPGMYEQMKRERDATDAISEAHKALQAAHDAHEARRRELKKAHDRAFRAWVRIAAEMHALDDQDEQ